MNVFVHYEDGAHPDYIEAAELAYTLLGQANNKSISFDARPLGLTLPSLGSEQYDSSWIEKVNVETGTSFLVITARDLGAAGLSFCYGRSAFNQRASIASSHRVSPTSFVGLVLHESGHSLGLVEASAPRHDNISAFIGHCANSCVMEPVNSPVEMEGVIQKVISRPDTSGFCGECITDLDVWQ